VIVADLDERRGGQPAVPDQLSPKGTTSSALECRMTVQGFTVLALPCFFQAGQSRTSRASPLLMLMATAPPRLEPTTACGRCLSNSAWAMRIASVGCVRRFGRLLRTGVH
jgi:hypothetical protein